MQLGPQDNVAPPAAPRRRTREHPSEGKWLGTAEVTNERDVRDVRGRPRGLRRLVPRPSKSWLDHWLVRYALLVLLLVFSLLFVEAARAQDGFVPVPELKARVTDAAGMLTPQQRNALESVLADYETRTGSQIAILTVHSTAPEPIEQYSIRVTDAWKLGRKGVDDGVLLLVAKDNPSSLRRLRIEAGRGVQGVLTDAQSKRVLQDVIAPHFRNNDYYGGLSAGVSAIATLLDKEHFPAPTAQPAPQQADGGSWWAWPAILFGLFFILPMMRGGRRRSNLHRSGWGSNATGILIGSAIGSALGNAHRHGGFGGGGFGGGGFGGGGFGGGGGTFDGGGASGDW